MAEIDQGSVTIFVPLVSVHDPAVLLQEGDLYSPQLSTLAGNPGQVLSVGGLGLLWLASVYGHLRLLEWDVERRPRPAQWDRPSRAGASRARGRLTTNDVFN